jgi:hypothetical protein
MQANILNTIVIGDLLEFETMVCAGQRQNYDWPRPVSLHFPVPCQTRFEVRSRIDLEHGAPWNGLGRVHGGRGEMRQARPLQPKGPIQIRD